MLLKHAGVRLWISIETEFLSQEFHQLHMIDLTPSNALEIHFIWNAVYLI